MSISSNSQLTENEEFSELTIDSLSDIEHQALERKIKQGKAHDHVVSIIQNSAKCGSRYLDLSQRCMMAIPEELLKLSHIENLYLEGNNITLIPEDFFQKLPNLRWLDLRNNNLISIPSSYIGSHRHLTHLLLQGNQLQSLPLELGLVTTLKGLSLSNNPIKFPPQAVLNKGIKETLKYLKHLLLSKSNGTFKPELNEEKADEGESNSETEDTGFKSDDTLASRERPYSAKSDSSEVTGKTLSLHKQISYQELKKTKMDALKKVGASGKLESNKKPLTTKQKEVSLYPEPPSADLIDTKVREKQSQAVQREKNEKVDAILQRRKNEEKLKKFRSKAKELQKQKDYEKFMNGGMIDFVEPAVQAPFGISDEDLSVMTNEERIKNGVRIEHERIRKVLSPEALRQMESEKYRKEQELKEKIRQHAEDMKARRKKPKGNAQEEMDAAMRELEIAKRLQQELDMRRRNLDYRFRAYNP